MKTLGAGSGLCIVALAFNNAEATCAFASNTALSDDGAVGCCDAGFGTAATGAEAGGLGQAVFGALGGIGVRLSLIALAKFNTS